MEVGEIVERTLADDRAFETGKPSGMRAISAALLSRNRAALDAPDLAELADEDRGHG